MRTIADTRRGGVRAMLRAIARARSARRLLDLDDHLLRDIGLTRNAAERVVRRTIL